MSAILIYFSHTGHTEYAAHKIAESVGIKVAPILVKVPYPAHIEYLEGRVNFEQSVYKHPDVAIPGVDINRYGHIILGGPVWFGHMATPVISLLNSYDMTGRIIYPFVTCGGIVQKTLWELKYCAERQKARFATPLIIRWGENNPYESFDKVYSWIEYCYKTYHIR